MPAPSLKFFLNLRSIFKPQSAENYMTSTHITNRHSDLTDLNIRHICSDLFLQKRKKKKEVVIHTPSNLPHMPYILLLPSPKMFTLLQLTCIVSFHSWNWRIFQFFNIILVNFKTKDLSSTWMWVLTQTASWKGNLILVFM